MPSLYRMGSWADRLQTISDVIDPAAVATHWYVNPATGNDNNDGVSPSSAWATIQKINDESRYCGLFPRSGGYSMGDWLHIDTTNANLLLGPSQFLIFTPSLNVEMLGGGEIQAWNTLPATAWSGPLSGTTKVYQAALTELNASCVIWENDKWLNHPTGFNLAAVQASLESTPGSFWTDGTTMYLHPFGDTNPQSDGKIYTRSYNRGGVGGSAVLVQVPDVHLKNLRIRKTCLAEKSSNDSILAYCYQAQGNAGGINFYEKCLGDYGSKHIYGFTDNATDRKTTLFQCVAEQGSPYYSQTPWVDYSPLSASCTNTTDYIECVTLKPRGLIGSSDGDPSGAAWICHNNGGGNYQFPQINFTNCQFNGTLDTYGAVQMVRVSGGMIGGGIFRSPDVLIERGRISQIVASNDQAGGSVRVRNCLITPVRINGGNGEAPAQGTVDYRNCVLDLRNTVSNTYHVANFARTAALNFIWKNNIVMGSQTQRFYLVNNAVASDTFVFNNNAYSFPVAGGIFFNYNNPGPGQTFTYLSDWQALGYDVGSFLTTNFLLDSNYKPLPGSPVIDTGENLGTVPDYSGVALSNRNDIGMWEYLTPSDMWKMQYFGTRANSGISADTSAPSNDGLPNLVKYATGLNPLLSGVLPVTSDTTTGYLRFTVQKNPQATDVVYTVEASNDLKAASWSTANTTIATNTNTLLSVMQNTPITQAPARFMRLRITRP